ncbi:MAG: 2-polyprenyl-6-hydroxyphenyl methylase/3-demethylubiquinone-9 3-methyltransferase [Lentisphaeria bacterium]|jgi:2-polyprenyl-6-hydroxyphenyl methylase/3-demethylubiquinone-9 3-methyltransferase
MKNSLISPTIDGQEVEHYRKLANTWWDIAGPFWPLHTLNRLRVRWIVKHLQQSALGHQQGELPLAGLSVLDVGCGGGILSESLARLGAEVVGMDVVEKNITIARAHAASAGLDIDYQYTTVEALHSSGHRFDVVFNMEVVEHVADLNTFMEACNALVKPGGATFIATINRNWLSWLIAIVGAEYVLRWLPQGTHRYHMLRKPREIKALLECDNFTVQNATGVAVSPFNRTMKLTSVLWVNYMFFATR